MKNDWLDYPLSVFTSGIGRVVGSFLLTFAAIALGTFAGIVQEFHLDNLPEKLSSTTVSEAIKAAADGFYETSIMGAVLLVFSIMFPICWPFLVGFFTGFFKLLRFDGHPFWMFWLMATCQFFIVFIEHWKMDTSDFNWLCAGLGLLMVAGGFAITLAMFSAMARYRAKLDQRTVIQMAEGGVDRSKTNTP